MTKCPHCGSKDRHMFACPKFNPERDAFHHPDLDTSVKPEVVESIRTHKIFLDLCHSWGIRLDLKPNYLRERMYKEFMEACDKVKGGA